MLTVAVLLLAALFGSSAAQTTSCVNAGYDLTSITGSDLFIYNATGNTQGTGTQYNWAIRPCGTVTTPGYCTSQPGEFCQGGTTVSSMNVSGSGVLSGAIWGQIQLNGQNGVAQFLQDGTNCGTVGDREGTIVYLCNSTATTPFISSLLELSPCNYQAVIQTSAICSQVPSTGVSTTVGTTVISQQCGGGVYDLTSINNADIIATLPDNTWAIRPCGNVAVQNCSGSSVNTSVCQYGINAGGYYGYAAGEWLPGKANVFYTYNAPGSLSQIMQDGQGCGLEGRYTNVTYVCTASATTPVLVAAAEGPQCHYSLTVQTTAVCGAAFAQLLGSSTGSVPAGGQSSVSSTPYVSSGSASVPVQTAATSAPSNNNPGNSATATAASLLAVVACALLALVMA